MKKAILGIAIVCAVLFVGCNSVPKDEDLSDDLSIQDITLRAQQAFDRGNYRGAIGYYEIMRNRFSENAEVQVQTAFEIGHIYLRQNKLKKAEESLTLVITRYDQPGGVLLPKKYYILAQNDLNEIKGKK